MSIVEGSWTQMNPGISGLVSAIYAEKGQTVKKGQVLLRLNESELRPRLAAAERGLDAARSAAKEACLAADQAVLNRARSDSLFAQGIIARQQYEETRTQADRQTATCAASRDRDREAETQVAGAQAALDNAVIVAPFDGVVLDVRSRPCVNQRARKVDDSRVRRAEPENHATAKVAVPWGYSGAPASLPARASVHHQRSAGSRLVFSAPRM